MDQGPEPIAYHDALAGGWDDRYGHGSFARRARFFARAILPLLPASGHWLDAGCGTGTFARIMAQGEGRSVAGVDASVAMVTEAARIASTEQAEARLSFQIVQSIEALPFPAEHFDGVICFSVLEYLERPLDALDELIRVLKPSGVIAFSIPHQLSAIRLVQRLYSRFKLGGSKGGCAYIALSNFSGTPRIIENLMKERSMSAIRMEYFDPFIPRLIHRCLKPSLIYVISRKGWGG